MGKFRDLSGKDFGSLHVLRRVANNRFNQIQYEVRCECGKKNVVTGGHLVSGDTTSCGCQSSRSMLGKKLTSHGATCGGKNTTEYNIWGSMLKRCSNENCRSFPHYGGRGITVCERWRKFEYFLEDMGLRPEGCTLGRIDNDRGYCKDNCVWSTRSEQANNTRRNTLLTHDGRTQTVAQWSRETGLSQGCIIGRMKTGWDHARIVTTPRRARSAHPRKTPEYTSWVAIRQRCYNPKNGSYHNYGGRGIKVCERWHVFANFLADTGPRPTGMSLDRIDNDGDYSPDNCRWATPGEQRANSRAVVNVTYKGETHCLSEWSRRTGLSTELISLRVRRGWPAERVLDTSILRRKNLVNNP